MTSPAAPADLLVVGTLCGIALIVVIGAVLGRVAVRFGQPAVIGELTAGIVLGPSLLGALPGNPVQVLFPDGSRPVISAVAQLGLLLFMFMVGWEFDLARMRRDRSAARVAVAVSVGSVALSFGLGAGLAVLLHPQHTTNDAGAAVPEFAFVVFLGAALSVTAFPVLARLLEERGMTGGRLGCIALTAAALDDVMAWILLAVASAAVSVAGGDDAVTTVVLLAAVFVGAMLFVVRPLLAALARWLGPHRTGPLLLVAGGGTFLSAYVTTWIGIHAIFGAFLMGAVMPREPAAVLARHVRGPLASVGNIMMPLFFVTTGLSVNLTALHPSDLLELAAILVVATVGKIGGTTLPARALGMPWREAGTLGLLMNMRGLTGLIILAAGRELGILDTRMFTLLVITALVTTALPGPLIRARPRAGTALPARDHALAGTPDGGTA